MKVTTSATLVAAFATSATAAQPAGLRDPAALPVPRPQRDRRRPRTARSTAPTPASARSGGSVVTATCGRSTSAAAPASPSRGALWVCNRDASAIVKLVRQQPDRLSGPARPLPANVVPGSDGAPWLTMRAATKSAASASTARSRSTRSRRLTPLRLRHHPARRALWFTEPGANKVGRIPTGVDRRARCRRRAAYPRRDRRRCRRRVWFAERDANAIGRITTDGVLNENGRAAARTRDPLALVAGKACFRPARGRRRRPHDLRRRGDQRSRYPSAIPTG